MESAAISKYVPAAANGLFLSAADSAVAAAVAAAEYHQQGQFPPQFYPNQEYGQMQQTYNLAPPQAGMPGGPPGFVNPYPVPRPNQQQPSQFSGILSQFKKTNGQFDFNKMMDTTGQMVSAVNQVGSLVKGFTSIFK
ncbi:hypothetical protein BAMTA208_05845 [Bacillus amyloliquefaciens TA208]|nr:hypothetical protein BAMTA208_05845 [Bacillus amyloliquefaciens TA208]